MALRSYAHMVRFVNTLLLAALVFLGISGVLMLYIDSQPWIFDLHRWVGFALLVLLPWKAAIVYRSLIRGFNKTFDRSVVIVLSLLLAFFILLVVVLGLMWMFRLGPEAVLLQSLISWHWILGLLLLPLAAVHVWRRWPYPRQADFTGRRSFLKLLGIAAAGAASAEIGDRLAHFRAGPASPRRFTGSQGVGSFLGNGFPVVGERIQLLDPAGWRLLISGAVSSPASYAYADLLGRRQSIQRETLDCTNGWFTVQDWQGVSLWDLVEEAGIFEAAAGMRLVSVTGYSHSYPMSEARQILLATHVSGERLEPRHGYPLRAVVPGRRGWFWVKWLHEVVVLDNPFDLALGILASPGEVARQWQ
jgi:DMSO/TMAO reductase YedYZ molybdopterin-dependent catalytic subunit